MKHYTWHCKKSQGRSLSMDMERSPTYCQVKKKIKVQKSICSIPSLGLIFSKRNNGRIKKMNTKSLSGGRWDWVSETRTEARLPEMYLVSQFSLWGHVSVYINKHKIINTHPHFPGSRSLHTAVTNILTCRTLHFYGILEVMCFLTLHYGILKHTDIEKMYNKPNVH